MTLRLGDSETRGLGDLEIFIFITIANFARCGPIQIEIQSGLLALNYTHTQAQVGGTGQALGAHIVRSNCIQISEIFCLFLVDIYLDL